MLGRTYDREVCSAARALEVAGERWSLLILRNAAFANMSRFSEFQASLGVAPNVLAARLELFVTEGLMSAVDTAGHPIYTLTSKGRDLMPALIALTEWGDRWAAPHGAPIRYEHAGCGGQVSSQLVCDHCGSILDPDAVAARPTDKMEAALRRRGGRPRPKP